MSKNVACDLEEIESITLIINDFYLNVVVAPDNKFDVSVNDANRNLQFSGDVLYINDGYQVKVHVIDRLDNRRSETRTSVFISQYDVPLIISRNNDIVTKIVLHRFNKESHFKEK